MLYDRWWNPAVEDQARDRAWRIGQTRTVICHRLICPGHRRRARRRGRRRQAPHRRSRAAEVELARRPRQRPAAHRARHPPRRVLTEDLLAADGGGRTREPAAPPQGSASGRTRAGARAPQRDFWGTESADDDARRAHPPGRRPHGHAPLAQLAAAPRTRDRRRALLRRRRREGRVARRRARRRVRAPRHGPAPTTTPTSKKTPFWREHQPVATDIGAGTLSTVANPVLDERSVGWLRYLYRKATTPDSWDRDGQPHEHWDDTSDPPMLCWHRFDLIDSTYAVAMMADITPAWREVYAPHPRRADLPPHRLVGGARLAHADRSRPRPRELSRHLPAAHPRASLGQLRRAGLDRERHRAVGSADGSDRRDRQPVLQGLLPRDARAAPAHDRRRPLERAVRHRARRREHVHVVPLRDRRAPARAVDERARRLPLREHEGLAVLPRRRRASGCSCTTCCAAPTTTRCSTTGGATCAAPSTCTSTATSCPQAVTLYYDPILDVHHEVPVMFGMVPAPYLAPQVPDDARRLFEAGMRQFGHVGADRAGRAARAARVGDRAVAGEGVGARPARRRARRDGRTSTTSPRGIATRGEFTWGFELDEPHPRGQYNGTMAAAQVATEQARGRGSPTVGPGSRFTDPTVVDVDFPTVALDARRGGTRERETLFVTPEPMQRTRRRRADDVPRREPARSRPAGRSSSKAAARSKPCSSATRSRCTRPRRPRRHLIARRA